MEKLLPFYQKKLIEAGCDEAGRGCLAGPVVAAAVILPKDFFHEFLNDSKQISEKKREILRPIIEREAIAFDVSYINELKIDEINILNASILGMHEAVKGLDPQPKFLAIDGNRFHAYPNIPHACIVKGDGKYMNIAAASILAKTYRDEYMERIHQEHPEYQWNKNKGYPTLAHRAAIKEFGSTIHHRQSFTLLAPEQLSLF
ncbi:MAG: ribonuclease HII [Crocinitomicaceae bacterium]|jgi:ribonuclease HII|nr:ribonuclease HII [Crocinitomicaceae bacterium]MDP4867154.1 ribonuclease HII [Crocinitomicaceae bacterium]MDP5009681.1 ribonuclease HII [Crocinitomicaceae bacterium]MDP5098909.1 ribonuclease HII [Crocinitomicaceae bacterium]